MDRFLKVKRINLRYALEFASFRDIKRSTLFGLNQSFVNRQFRKSLFTSLLLRDPEQILQAISLCKVNTVSDEKRFLHSDGRAVFFVAGRQCVAYRGDC